ncbi:uncharacterized protein LOC134248672 [Saccostrea cucullata]|uniref:uncharacterized protein LOC134248672 n=1 Tax=Saccostrea cuccullata TaxID=36930 RepID=UPI002ED2E32A
MMPFDCWIPCFYFGSPLNDQWKDSISEIPKFFVEQYKPKDIKVLIFKNLIQLEVHITFSENGTHGTFPLFMISDTVFDLNEHILFCNTDLHISDFKYSESRIGHFYSNPTPESESVKNNKNLLSCFGLQPHHLINDTGPSLKNDLQKCDTRLCMESRLHQQWHTFNLNLLMELTTKFLLMYFFISIIGSKCFPIQLISAQHCEISNISMKIVESCPFNLESWKQRSKLKNCSSLYKHSTCSWPENYVYHCVIDHFMSVKMEMCAVEAYINLGYCAEYNTKGELIQANYEAKCHHCPGRYLSSTAYKYQECYNMTQKPEITTLEHLGTSEDKTTTFTSINRTTQQNDRERNSFNGIGVTLGTILAVLFISVIIIILRCYPKYKG